MRPAVRPTAQVLMTALLLGGAATCAWGTDTYDPVHRQLTIPAITIGGATYSTVVVTVDGIVSGPAGTLANGVVDTYDPATKQLHVPAVTIPGGATYYNVVATVAALDSIGGVVGADVYDGTHLTIPVVEVVGGPVYSNVVVVIDKVVSTGGGMPVNALDQYNTGARQLTVAAALDQASGRVFTNAVVSIKSIVSAGGVGNTSLMIIEHALAQTGLAIGLASTVLQSQLDVVFAAQGGYPTCGTVGGSGVLSGATNGLVTVFYDTACTRPYVAANATVTTGTSPSGANQANIAETAIYYGPGGNTIGTLTLHESVLEVTGASNALTALTVSGLGIFTPSAGVQMPVQLGLYCTIPVSESASTTLPCAGGIAQDFPALGLAVGAVTPLTLQIDTSVAAEPVTFVGTGSTVDIGALGSLTLTAPSPTSMVVTGGSQVSSFTASGGAAAFELFPPTPTAWTLTDPTSGLQLQVTVASDTVRNLSLAITNPATSATLASGEIDQSGTGAITFSNGTVEQITSWTLGGPAAPN